MTVGDVEVLLRDDPPLPAFQSGRVRVPGRAPGCSDLSLSFDSTLETTFDSTVTTEVNGRTIAALAGRPSPVTWRLGQACPRLQAGDAPSLGAGYPRSGTARFIHTDPSRFMYTTPLRRAAVSRLGNMAQMDTSEKAGSDLDVSSEVDVGGYMSDGDILGKSLRTDDLNSG